MTQKRIALFGLSANPPGWNHLEVLKKVKKTNFFDQIIVVPCGPRPDKETVNDIELVHRAHMLELALSYVPGVKIDLKDLEENIFTPTIELEKRYRNYGEIWHIVGADLVKEGSAGRSPIQKYWDYGEYLWENSRFVVVERPSFPISRSDLPPNSRQEPLPRTKGSSTEIRENVFNHRPITKLTPNKVENYIYRYGLYRGMYPQKRSSFKLGELKPYVCFNKNSSLAKGLAQEFQSFAPKQANIILAFGGDGTVLETVRSYWRKRIPILGVNTGSRGFLANSLESFQDLQLPNKLNIFHTSLLFIEAELISGKKVTSLAFNEAGVRNRTDYQKRKIQSANISIQVKGPLNMEAPYMSGDGAIVATPQGSTAYAKAMGSLPLRIDSTSLVLVGNNIDTPPWTGGAIYGDSVVTINNLDTQKRPINAFADNILLGEVARVKIRKSRVAAAELLFLPDHDIMKKNVEASFAGFNIKNP